MGAWKRCGVCGGRVRVLAVMRLGEVDLDHEAWSCLNPRCQRVEVVGRGARGRVGGDFHGGTGEVQDRGEVA